MPSLAYTSTTGRHDPSAATRDPVHMTQMHDASSNANYREWTTLHTTLDVNVNFQRRVLHGLCKLEMESQSSSTEIILDTSYLDVQAVTINGEGASFVLKPRKEPLGQPLHISLPSKSSASKRFTVSIEYATTDACTALQWLEPAQTAGTKPYMFSQCQAIHARSMCPCQDTPLIKSKFTFLLRSSYPVVATGLFKGNSEYGNGDLAYEYQQPIPIPSYLAAIASGDLATAQIGPRSTLYTEPKYLYESQKEMAPVTEKFITIAESFLPKYAWTSYNVLILPQSFPYGGMENPNITYATPTILAGDGSNLDVIAHELSHSWSGNLVTCAGWSHFWLNEGWTVFLERKIVEKLYGKKYAEFSAIIGWKALEESVKNYGDDHNFTKLIPDLNGVDPDDAFSSIPYEKGFNFLYYLEGLLGAESFAKFTYFYFEKFAGKSITSFQFKASLYEFYGDAEDQKRLDSVNWDDKFYSTGLPPRPSFDTTVAIPCYSLAKRWIDAKNGDGFSIEDVKDWDAGQYQVLLETLSSSAFKSPEKLLALGSIYQLTKSKNAEILFRYYSLGLDVHARPLYEDVAAFLGTVGRMKFVRPLFRGLNKVDKALAKETFEKVGTGLHPICREQVRKDLGLK